MWQGKIISAIKSGESKAIEIGGQVVDKGKEVVAGVIDSSGKLVDVPVTYPYDPTQRPGLYSVL